MATDSGLNRLSELLIKEHIDYCEACGSHITRSGWSLHCINKRYPTDPLSYIMLCSNCSAKAEHGFLSKDTLMACAGTREHDLNEWIYDVILEDHNQNYDGIKQESQDEIYDNDSLGQEDDSFISQPVNNPTYNIPAIIIGTILLLIGVGFLLWGGYEYSNLQLLKLFYGQSIEQTIWTHILIGFCGVVIGCGALSAYKN